MCVEREALALKGNSVGEWEWEEWYCCYHCVSFILCRWKAKFREIWDWRWATPLHYYPTPPSLPAEAHSIRWHTLRLVLTDVYILFSGVIALLPSSTFIMSQGFGGKYSVNFRYNVCIGLYEAVNMDPVTCTAKTHNILRGGSWDYVMLHAGAVVVWMSKTSCAPFENERFKWKLYGNYVKYPCHYWWERV